MQVSMCVQYDHAQCMPTDTSALTWPQKEKDQETTRGALLPTPCNPKTKEML